jgi:hypothetical protein
VTSLHKRIESLPDEQAGSALVLALDLGNEKLDLIELTGVQEHLIEALDDPDLAEFMVPREHSSPGDLARLALAHLAELDRTRVQHAVNAVDGRSERDPTAALAIGALILYAFSTELKIERDPDKGWAFLFHKKPMEDSTVGKLLSQLYSTFIGGSGS